MGSPNQRLRERRSRDAVAVAVALARSHGLAVEEPTVLADLFSVMVHLRPAPVVARVPTWISRLRTPVGDWLAREVAVTTFLAEQGAPVATPSRELPPGPHRHDGHTISFWTYLEPDPDRMPTAAGGEAQPLHGDAHPGNLVATRDGLVWIDFEEVCRGPVEWDLATMMDPDAVAAHHRPDPEVLARCTELRHLQVVLCLLALSDVFGDLDGWDESIRSLLGTLPPTPDRQAEGG